MLQNNGQMAAGLPVEWVDNLFEKLALVYGAEWRRKWDGLDREKVKADWAIELAGFANHPEALAWALQNLPETAPNVLAFKAIARRAPAAELPRLEAPIAKPGTVAAALGKLEPVLKPKPGGDNREWARRICARADGGERMSPTVLKMARDVLRHERAPEVQP